MKRLTSHLVTIVMLVLVSNLSAQSEVLTGENVAVTNNNSGKVRGYIENGIFAYKGIPWHGKTTRSARKTGIL